MQQSSKPKLGKENKGNKRQYNLIHSPALFVILHPIQRGINTQEKLRLELNKEKSTISEQLTVLENNKTLVVRKHGKEKEYSLNPEGIVNRLLDYLRLPEILDIVYHDRLLPFFGSKKLYEKECKSLTDGNETFVKAEKTIKQNKQFPKIFFEVFKQAIEHKRLKNIGEAYMLTMKSFCNSFKVEGNQMVSELIKENELTQEEIISLGLIFGFYADIYWFKRFLPSQM